MDGINDISFPNLGIYLKNVGDSVSIFGKQIMFYAIIIASAFIIAMLIAKRQAKKTGQNEEIYLDALLVLVLPSILGARLYFVLFNLAYYKEHISEIFQIWNGGLGIYGGVIAGVITMFIFCRIRKLSVGLVFDTIAPGLIFAQMLGRWGNFFNREAYGADTNCIFAMRLPVEYARMRVEDANRIIHEGAFDYIQVHPTFLYESVWSLGVFLLLIIFRAKKKYDGQVFLWYVMGYALGRVWIEGLRTDQLILGHIGGTAIPASQLLAVILIVTVGVMLIVLHFHPPVGKEKILSSK